MSVNLGAIRDLLLPGVRKVTGEYKQIPTQWSKVYNTGKSKMAVERTVNMRFLGLAQLKSEGGATSFDNGAGERYVYNQEHLEIGLGYAITRKAIDDNLYKTSFRPSNLGLQRSFAQTKEILGANVLNTANVYNGAVVGDGVSLINTAHPIDNGTFANQPFVDVDLNEATLQSALIQIRQFKDNAGLKLQCRGRKLVVPIQLEYVASRLTKTELRPGTADNDVNALITTGALPEGYVVMDFLTSAYAWFVLTDSDEGLLYLERVPFETDMQVDFTTDNLLVKGYERYSFGYDGPRGIWGTFPSN
jgi:hypothetical protein